MKIKQRTEVTIVTHEITLLRIQKCEAEGDPAVEIARSRSRPRSSQDSPSEGNEEGTGKEYEAEK